MAVSQEHSNYLVYARFSLGAISLKSADKDNNLGAVFTAPPVFFSINSFFSLRILLCAPLVALLYYAVELCLREAKRCIVRRALPRYFVLVLRMNYNII